LKLSALIDRFDLETRGDYDDFEIGGVRTLVEAEAGDLSFLANPKYREQALATKASALLTRAWLPGCPAVQLICGDPYLVLARAVQALYPEPHPPAGVHKTATVDPGASVSKEATIGPNCVIEAGAHVGAGSILTANITVGTGAVIGEGCRLFPGVVIYGDCRLGNRVRIHANTVIGSDGFGYAQDGATHVKIPQIGGVVIGDDVEIGANCSVDRGALSDTEIGPGTIIDNQVQIGHNVRIGKGAILIAQTGISGSATVGDHSVLAGKVGVTGHVHIGDRVVVMGDSVVTKDLTEPGRYAGNPAIPHIQYQRQLARVRKLEKLEARVKAMEARLDKE